MSLLQSFEKSLSDLAFFPPSILPDTVVKLAVRKKAIFTHAYLGAVRKTHYNSRLNWQSVPLITCSHLKYPAKPHN